MVCPNCKKESPVASQRFCGFCGALLDSTGDSAYIEQKRQLDEAWEAGKERGRKEEREHEANKARTFLWASVVLGAIGGGVIGGQVSGPPERQLSGIVIGAIVGGLIGGMQYFFGCCLTTIIFILGAIVLVASAIC